jgi:3-deoxy-D-manno-octulosonate 8-phosphate phosphatase KdsC-like HAD superfamily phosphatase
MTSYPSLSNWATGHGLTLDQVPFVGNDINDVECLRGAGLGVVVGDAYPVAVEAADMQLTRNGGRGAVREFADLWLAAR